MNFFSLSKRLYNKAQMNPNPKLFALTFKNFVFSYDGYLCFVMFPFGLYINYLLFTQVKKDNACYLETNNFNKP
jgi:hypothetical protein